MSVHRGADSTSWAGVDRGRPRPRLAALLLASTIATAGIGWLSRAPYGSGAAEAALLRLSWRLRGGVVESCRKRTQTELNALPVHMRTPEICDRRPVAYRLIVQLDGGRVDTTRIVSGGVKGDRPLFVLHETAWAPGAHRVFVRFEQEDDVGPVPPVRLAMDTVLQAHAGTIDLITLDPGARRLVHRAPSPP